MKKEGYINVTGGKVWYEMYGSDRNETPVIVLHGGPGSSSWSLQGLQVMGEKRPVILYDQLGCGRSDRPTDESLWNIDRFVEEVKQVKDALNIEEWDILGHSWGTTLAAAYYLKYPEGTRKIIFSSPCLSAPLWAADQDENRKQLPIDVQRVLIQGEETGETNTEAYKKATDIFNQRFVCRLDPKPAFLEKGKAYKNTDIYLHMWGPSEFYVTGNLKEMDFTEELGKISVPTLYICGRFDEATPKSTEYYASLTPHSEFHVFEQSAHMAYLEETAEYLRVVDTFLEQT